MDFFLEAKNFICFTYSIGPSRTRLAWTLKSCLNSLVKQYTQGSLKVKYCLKKIILIEKVKHLLVKGTNNTLKRIIQEENEAKSKSCTSPHRVLASMF